MSNFVASSPVDLLDLGVVHAVFEVDGLQIDTVAVRRELDAISLSSDTSVMKAAPNSRDCETSHDRTSLLSASSRPMSTHRQRQTAFLCAGVLLLRAGERPDLVTLNMLALEVAQRGASTRTRGAHVRPTA